MTSAKLAFIIAVAAIPAAARDPYASALELLQPQHHRAAAAPAMTLDEVEAAALENNPELKVAGRRIALAELNAGTAGRLEDPRFMFRSWGAPLSQPWNLNRAQNMFMLSRELPGRGKRALDREIAAQGVTTSRAQLDALRRDLSARVRVAYYELLRNQDELRLHDQQVALARQAVEVARIKYTVGRVPQQDVLKAQIALTRLADHLLMFQQEGELSRATLNTLMGRSPDAPLAVSGAYAPPTFLPDLPALEHVALNNRPELRAAASMLRRDQLAIDLARKAYTPDFEVGGGYMLSPSGMDDRNGYMAELVIGLPWLNRKKHDAEIARAGAAASVQEAEIENLRTVVRQEIQMALIRANTARKLVDVYASTLRPQAQATLKSATAAYQADRTDFLNLIDSQNTLLEVEYSYYRALAELETRWAELELAVGTTIERHPATAEVRQ